MKIIPALGTLQLSSYMLKRFGVNCFNERVPDAAPPPRYNIVHGNVGIHDNSGNYLMIVNDCRFIIYMTEDKYLSNRDSLLPVVEAFETDMSRVYVKRGLRVEINIVHPDTNFNEPLEAL